ncbi:nitroreductase family protein [Clostridium sp. LIBA-8841]|uniref:nitroreductase family protein n=1 Tax=Clostridium sp. LIBA-8841 TaxID=2987530 RepID=UPI002AC6D00F|nr:nitroreductase family protein [Clostridium sp. LIBA-8841]MDZ5253497.1 nitroreductase family protein [Clostridium sp. LIBA-8841]
MFKVNKEKCIACTQCIKDCPVNDISLVDEKANIKNRNCIKCGHCIAVCPTKAVSTDDYNMEEVKEYDKETFDIESENLLNFIKFRRSVRRFKDKDVEKEKLEKILEAGRFTQTAVNSQDVSYVVITEKIAELRDLAYESLKEKGEYILNNLNDENKHLRRYALIWTKMYKAYKADPIKNDRLFFNAPVIIVAFSHHDLDGELASSNMELMTNALGLGTFFSGFLQLAAEGNEKILTLLGVENKKIASCMVIGYPAITYKRTAPRKKVEVNWI